MEIKVQGSMTRRDILEVFKLHLAPSKRSIYVRMGLIVVAIAAMLVVAHLGMGTWRTYLLGLIVIEGILMPWWLPYLQVTGVKKRNPLLKPITGQIDEKGVQLNGEFFNSNMSWASFSTFKAGKRVVLLYQNRNDFNFLSAGLFQTAGDWEGCLRLVETHLKKAE